MLDRSRAAVIVAAFAAGMLVTLVIVRAWSARRPPPDDMRGLRSRLSTMEMRVAQALEARQADAHPSAAAAVRLPPVPPSPPIASVAPGVPERALSPEEIIFAEQQEQDKVAARIDRYMQSEPLDASWSRRSGQAIAVAFATIRGSAIAQSDCRSTVCRVAVVSESKSEQKLLARKILSQAPFQDDEVIFSYDFESAPPRTVLYLGREGSRLAQLGLNQIE